MLLWLKLQFSSRCAWKSPYALHPVSQKFPQRCLWNGSNVRLTGDGPLSSFQGRSSIASSLHASLLQAIDVVSDVLGFAGALFPQVVLKLWNGSNVRLTGDGPLSSFQRRSSSASSLLQAIDGVMSLVSCRLQVALNCHALSFTGSELLHIVLNWYTLTGGHLRNCGKTQSMHSSLISTRLFK